MKLDIEFDYTEIDDKLTELKEVCPNIVKKLMTAVMKPIRQDVKRLVSSNFRRRTGRLYRSINYWAFNDWAAAITTKQTIKSKSAWYSNFLESGATIQTKHKKYLTFKIDGVWKKVKSVNIPSKPFMKPIADNYFGGSALKATEIIELQLQIQLDKLMKKGILNNDRS